MLLFLPDVQIATKPIQDYYDAIQEYYDISKFI